MLQVLIDYAKREGLTTQPGLKAKTVRWLLVFSLQGDFLGVQDLAGGNPRSKGREFPACPDLRQPEMVAAGSGCRPFLVDGLDVVALLSKDGQVDDKLAAKHRYFVDLLRQAASCLAAFGPVAEALEQPSALEAIRLKLIEGRAKPVELATVAFSDGAGVTIPVETDSWHDWWQTFRQNLTQGKAKAGPGRKGKPKADDDSRMVCLLSGEPIDPLPTHNKIEGLSDVGGLAMGDALTSFDKDAFASFGLEQGANAAMSEEMVKAYTAALNHAIRNRGHRLAGVKVVYWYSRPVAAEDDPLRELLEGFGLPAADDLEAANGLTSQAVVAADRREQIQAEGCAHRLLTAIRSGEMPKIPADARYWVLTLSANHGRVVIRDWMEGAFQELLEAVDAWFEDLAIISRDGSRIIPSQKFAAVLAAPLRDLKDAQAPMTAALWRCALRRTPIPHQFMTQTLHRVRIDFVTGESPRHARLALLKAYCNREKRIPNMSPELNAYETNPAYLCGRIMALLARIQQAALGDVGAGVVQRYYAAASATPALVLGRLVRTAQVGHLPKIDNPGLQRWFEGQLAEVWAKLQTVPPTVLSLEEQTLFAMGYYHQTAQRWQRAQGDTQSASDANP